MSKKILFAIGLVALCANAASVQKFAGTVRVGLTALWGAEQLKGIFMQGGSRKTACEPATGESQ